MHEATGSSNLEVLRAGIEMFNRGEIDATAELFDPDVTIYDPDGTGQTFRGHDGLRSLWAEWLENWEGYRMDAKEFIEEGDEIFVAGTQSARGRASEIEVIAHIFVLYRMRDGKVTEMRLYTDRGPALDSMHG